MRKYLTLIILILILSSVVLNAEESQKGIYHNFSGGLGTGLNLTFFDSYFGKEKRTIPILFFEFNFKFDYIFLKSINSNYNVGFGLAIGDGINLGGLDLTSIYIVYSLAPYIFFNRVTQKLTFINTLGDHTKQKYAIFEGGLTISFVNFYAFDIYYNEQIYYLTSFISPYLFVGFWGVSNNGKSLSHIVGGYIECNFDLLKDSKEIYSSMKAIYCYLNFGIEYRVGYRVEKH